MSPDFVEMLSALSAAGAEFTVVGAHALAVHGRPGATGDLGLWVRPTPSCLTFEEAWDQRVEVTVQGVRVPVLGREALIEHKLAVGRPRDLADVAELRGED